MSLAGALSGLPQRSPLLAVHLAQALLEADCQRVDRQDIPPRALHPTHVLATMVPVLGTVTWTFELCHCSAALLHQPYEIHSRPHPRR